MSSKRGRKKKDQVSDSGTGGDVTIGSDLPPRRPYGDKLTETVSFRTTKENKDRFKKRVQESGWTHADFFRAVFEGSDARIVYKPINPRTLPDFRGAAFQIRKAGNNLNQIAHALNRAAKQKHIDKRLALAAIVQLNAIHREFVASIELDAEPEQGGAEDRSC